MYLMNSSSKISRDIFMLKMTRVRNNCPRGNYTYSHLSNNRGGWNKRGGSAKVAKSLNVELGINMEAGLFFKIIKRGGGKTYLINVEGGTYL